MDSRRTINQQNCKGSVQELLQFGKKLERRVPASCMTQDQDKRSPRVGIGVLVFKKDNKVLIGKR